MSACAHRLIAFLAVLCVIAWGRTAKAGDPYLVWYTVRTPHYRVHYCGGLEPQAQRIASLAELLRERLGRELNYRPREAVDILITDGTDDANGWAQILPHNRIALYATGPDDMSSLGDYDDWMVGLLTHEHAHTSYLDNVSGVPGLANALLGKTYAPNMLAPKWIAEGLAVALESKYTSGGRLRSSQFDMYLRADVLENNIARLDEMGNPVRRWPAGTLWYLYGGRFVEWIEWVYGPEVYAAVAADYGASVIPWGVNRSIRRVTGRTYEQLYQGWLAFLRERYTAQAEAVTRRGVRSGTRLTWRGRGAAGPRFVPACARLGSEEELLYFREDGHNTSGLYRLALRSRNQAGTAELVARSGTTAGSFDSECNLVFNNQAPSRRLYYFNDLIRQPRGTTSPRGIEATRQRLTVGERAHSPDVSPDGRQLVYVTNRAGTSTLRIADYAPQGKPSRVRALVSSVRYEQAYSPRFSPDGSSVAYSVWTRGGYRDVRVVEVATGRWRAITRDRALDQQPSWSPDGRFLYFVSDRTGIANVYAHEVATGRLHQVTNVITGAYFPEVAPDNKTLFYLGYSSAGFDLYALPLEPRNWLSALPYRDLRPDPLPTPPERRWPVEKYSAWETLRPYAYTLQYGPGVFGPTLTGSMSGSDALGLHAWAASIAVEARQGEPALALDYAYNRLPASLGVSLYRSALPRTGYRFGDQTPTVIEHATGMTSSVTFPIPGEFAQQAVALSFSMLEFNTALPVGDRADPYSLITTEPHRGFLAETRLVYSYSNVEASTYAISAEKGWAFTAASDVAAHELGSESTLQVVTLQLQGYLPMPWNPHHVLALAGAGGSAAGTYPRRGYFYTGGFTSLPLWDSLRSGVMQGGFLLRGYEPAQFIGRNYSLFSTEYRFPLLYADRGVSTLPVFLRTLSGAAFADFGGAFDEVNRDDPWDSYHLGLGAELWLDLVFGHEVSAQLRFGHAQGTDSKAPHGGRTYAVLAAAF